MSTTCSLQAQTLPRSALPGAWRPRHAWPVRWWLACQAAWHAGREVLAREAPALPPEALSSLQQLDDRLLQDIGLPPGTQALVAHERVRQRDTLWALSRGAVMPSVERSFF